MLDSLFLKLPRDTEVTPEMAKNFLSALSAVLKRPGILGKLIGKKSPPLALELVTTNQQVQFVITSDSNLTEFISTQLQSNYPLVVVKKIKDPIAQMGEELYTTSLILSKPNYFPVNTYTSFTDVDPLASILAVMSKANEDENILVQLAIEAANSAWQKQGQKAMDTGRPGDEPEQTKALPEQQAIKEKISYPGYFFTLRIAATSQSRLAELSSSFGVFARSDGNGFSPKNSKFKNSKTHSQLLERKVNGNQVLNVVELATLWHLPGEKVKVANVAWGQSVLSEAPDNLPTPDSLSDEQKQNINFFAKTIFKNHEVTFGIKAIDRRRHIWAIGKTGTGKSTLIANMAIDDLKKDRGMAIIDPHGDLCDIILQYVPSHRINDVIYFNPADKEYTVSINPLEHKDPSERELVVSGIVSIFNKLYGHSWGPRLEYILRNALLTLAEVEDTTLADVLKILSDRKYRDHIVGRINDEVMKSFWLDEFNQMPDKLRQESISPIQNKIGQFVASPSIRSVIANPHSSIDLDDIMNSGKILIVNLSQGRLGEDNAALMGAMLITKLQLSAMRRVELPEEKRKDFYLYVDEFQNFATTSFIKILSEARKYRLNLTMANQYMAQVPEEISKAILGNVGSIISFTIGADDAAFIKREFSEVFSENDLVELSNYQIALKLMIDAHSSRPFLAQTLPLPVSRNRNRDKVIKVSRERYARKK